MSVFLKRFVSSLLLTFVVLSIGIATLRQSRIVVPTSLPEGKSLILFHAQTRCPTCLKMERLTRLLLEEKFQQELNEEKLHFLVLEFDDPQNRSIAKEYHIATASILLLDRQENRTVKSRNLLEKCWNSIENETLFLDMLSEELSHFLGSS